MIQKLQLTILYLCNFLGDLPDDLQPPFLGLLQVIALGGEVRPPLALPTCFLHLRRPPSRQCCPMRI